MSPTTSNLERQGGGANADNGNMVVDSEASSISSPGVAWSAGEDVLVDEELVIC